MASRVSRLPIVVVVIPMLTSGWLHLPLYAILQVVHEYLISDVVLILKCSAGSHASGYHFTLAPVARCSINDSVLNSNLLDFISLTL